MEIWGKSKAIHGTWFFLPEYNFLMDAGDGVSSTLGIHGSDIHYIFITHAHLDHITGLLGLGRFQKRTLQNEPNRFICKVLYLKGCRDKMIFIKNFLREFGVNLDFIELDEGLEFEIKKNIFVKPFPVDHTASYYKNRMPAYGCHLIEKRRRLKPEFASKREALLKEFGNGKEGERAFAEFIMNVKKTQGEDSISENYDKVLLSYCGDSEPVSPKILKDTDILLHEATFLNKDEMEAAHSCFEDVLEVAIKSKVKALIVYHLSERYKREMPQYKEVMNKMAVKAGLSCPLFIVGVDEYFRVNIEL